MYTMFSQKAKELGEIVIMLEKVYHPKDNITVHYLAEQPDIKDKKKEVEQRLNISDQTNSIEESPSENADGAF